MLSALRRLVAPLPVPPEECEPFHKDFVTALVALSSMYGKVSRVAAHSPRHAVLAARYDQAIRLLLADSVNIRTEGFDEE